MMMRLIRNYYELLHVYHWLGLHFIDAGVGIIFYSYIWKQLLIVVQAVYFWIKLK